MFKLCYTLSLLEQILVQNNLLSTLPVLRTSWYLSFDVKPKSVSTLHEYANIMHAKARERNEPAAGWRIPGIWFKRHTFALHICFNFNTDICYDTPYQLLANTYTNVNLILYEVENVFKLFIIIGNKSPAEYIITAPMEFQNVDVYASTFYTWDPADASIKNFVFHNIEW